MNRRAGQKSSTRAARADSGSPFVSRGAGARVATPRGCAPSQGVTTRWMTTGPAASLTTTVASVVSNRTVVLSPR